MSLKKEESFNLKLYDHLDVKNIANHISSFKDEWFLDTSRQDLYEHHRLTYSYFITNINLNMGMNDGIFCCKDTVLLEMTKPIIEKIENLYSGKVGKSLYIKLPPKAYIEFHHDSGDYLNNARRFHIPIITNNNAGFFVKPDLIHMREGEVWEINNFKAHYVFNAGDTDRVHLLVDVIPNSRMGEK